VAPAGPPSPPAETSADASVPALTVEEVEIRNGRFTYRDGRNGASHTVAIASLAWSPASEAGRIQLSARGDYNSHPFDIAGTAGRPATLFDPDAVWPVDLVVKSAGWTVAATGSLRDARKAVGVDMMIRIEGDTGAVPRLGELAGLAAPLPDAGPVRFTGRLHDPAPGVLALDDIALEAGPAGAVFTARGGVGDLPAWKDVRLELRLAAPSLPRLGALVDAGDLPDIGPVSLDAELIMPDAATVRVADLKAAFLESDLGGTATLNRSGDLPKLTAKLSSQRLDLRPFSGQAAPDAPAGDEKTKSTGGDRVFSSAPLPLEGLKRVDADVQLRLASVLMEKAALTDVAADIRLDGGRLRAAPIQATAGGARVTAALEVNAAGKIPAFSKKIKVDRLDLGKMFEGLGIRDAIGGTGDVDANLTGRGRSVAEIMGGMNGRVLFALQNGFVKRRYLDLISFDFAGGIYQQLFSLLGTPPDGRADIQCLFANLDIQDGIVDVSPLVMKTPEMTVFGAGDVNLKTERLNLSVSSEPTRDTAVIRFGLGQLAKMFKLTGTLARPSLGIDPVKSSVVLAQMFGGTAMAGTTLAAQSLLGSRSAKENPCLQMTATSDPEAPPGTEGGKPEAPLQKVIKDTGKSILNIFKKE
jgi:hypothetical protein